MAERLRRKIRNLLGFSRAGSSPAGVVSFCWIFYYDINPQFSYLMGLKKSELCIETPNVY